MWWMLSALAAPPTIDEPLRTGATAPGDAAVVVGIEDYAFVDDVPYARRDAEAVRTWLVYDRGVPASRVQTLHDASREQVLQALERAVDQVDAAGTVWLYWAGHGAADPADGERLLLGVDVMPDPSVFASRGLTVSEIEAVLGDARSVLWLDTCYTGAARGDGSLLGGSRPIVPSWATAPHESIALWTATSGQQLSHPHEPARHGLFTYVSVGALRGWADGELDGRRDGQVTAAEAQAYVRRVGAELGGHGQQARWRGPRGQVLAPRAPEAAPTQAALEDAPDVIRSIIGTTGEYGEFDGFGDAVASIDAPTTDAPPARPAPAPSGPPPEVVAELASPLRKQARADFRQLDRSGTVRKTARALEAYIDQWSEAEVAVAGFPRIPIDLPQVPKAETALRELRDRQRRRSTVRLGIGLGSLALAASSGAVTLATNIRYQEAPLSNDDLSGLYRTNRAAGFTALGLAAVGVGFTTSAFPGVTR